MERDQESRSLEDIYRDERELEGEVAIPPQIARDYSTFLESHRGVEDLGTLIGELKKHRELAKQNPGEIVEGNPILGAPHRYYSPTEEEKRVSEIGKTIQAVVSGCKDLKSCVRLARYLADNSLYEDMITYDLYYFYHVDVVGSGRFVYPEGPFQRSFSIIETMLKRLADSTEVSAEELQRLEDMRMGNMQDMRACLEGIQKLVTNEKD